MIKRFYFFACCLAAGLFTVTASAQTEPETATIAIYGGLTIFNNPTFDSVSLVEFPFVLNREQFDFYKADSAAEGLEARIYCRAVVANFQGILVDSASTYFSAWVANEQEARLKGIRLFNQLDIFLKPGLYTVALSAIDVVSKREGQITYNRVEVPAIEREHLTLGAANLAYAITPATATAAPEDRSVRNGLRVLVNPVHWFGPADSSLYFYGEVYNLKYGDQEKSKYRVASHMVDAKNSLYQDFGFSLRDKAGNTAVLSQRYDISAYPPGKYGLNVTVTDEATQQSDTAFLPFKIVAEGANPVAEVTAVDPTSAYDSLSLEAKLALVYYLLSPVEKKTLEALSPTGKQNFMQQYWREHDSDPTTRPIENQLEMIRRYQFANVSFSTNANRTNGWSSDRGRIYMIYGPWDERDDVPTPVTGNPFEVWFYRQVDKGLLFVFADTKGSQDPQLVHSNATGEKYSDSWQTIVDQGIYNIK